MRSARSAELGEGVQAAGAIVEDRQIAAVIEAGARRVVLGSAALDDLDETRRLIERYGERLVIGIEVDRDRIRARGRRTTDLPLAETLSAVHDAGAARIVITSVRRVSTMTGPDVGALALSVRLGLAVHRGRRDRLDRRPRRREGRRGRRRDRRPCGARGPARPGTRDRVRRMTRRPGPTARRRPLDSGPHGLPHRPGRRATARARTASARRFDVADARAGHASRSGLRRGAPRPRRRSRRDRRGQTSVAVRGSDRRSRPGSAGSRVRLRRRGGDLGAHRAGAFPRLARGSARGADGVRSAGAPQGLPDPPLRTDRVARRPGPTPSC